ncbi:hypothetical protein OS493_035328 [Desmophyllum pertusum]|uniref:Uncharacterized protein n=1 Tax=Desmophyllum pertusum TaxID=174260 RepID=A0A9X0CJW6_9CNID|nr:hypothetical protein OS493_035328 [Desmophyllum pertusum]
MAARNRKKRQQNNVEATDLGGAPKDLLAAIRKLEAQLAQEKFFHDKSRTEQQHEIKTLNGKVKNLERQKKVLLQKLEQNPSDQQQDMQSELNDTNNKLKEVNQKLAVSLSTTRDKLLRSNKGIKRANEKNTQQFPGPNKGKNLKIKKLEVSGNLNPSFEQFWTEMINFKFETVFSSTITFLRSF